ncbi:enoyl-CoA hydratase/isomerase family protein [Saccharopolyspora spinosa]|uniref:enoyl-CoA hydratase/isomerase family protein n=1 Tax=Saccharopolyspora spinosa TaxID=60894 RepID=UPI00376EB50F
MPAEGFVTVTRDEGSTIAELNRPDEGNILTLEMLDALSTALHEAEHDPNCSAFVLCAAYDSFCMGDDLRKLASENIDVFLSSYWRFVANLASAAVPTVAVVTGPAVGGGVGLTAACDIAICGPKATFQLPEVFFGMLPTILLPPLAWRIGPQRALRLAALGEIVSAEMAPELGLVDLLSSNPVAAKREVLEVLHRSDRDTIAVVKRIHRAEFSLDTWFKEYRKLLLDVRWNDPKVVDRVQRMIREGVL